MTGNAVSEVDAPRQRRRVAVGMVVETRQEAADAPDRDAGDQRQRKRIAAGSMRADCTLDEFDADQAAEQGADDRFALEQVAPVRESSERVARVLDPVA